MILSHSYKLNINSNNKIVVFQTWKRHLYILIWEQKTIANRIERFLENIKTHKTYTVNILFCNFFVLYLLIFYVFNKINYHINYWDKTLTLTASITLYITIFLLISVNKTLNVNTNYNVYYWKFYVMFQFKIKICVLFYVRCNIGWCLCNKLSN